MRAVLQRSSRKAGGDGGKAERDRKAERPPARRKTGANTGNRQRDRRPYRRLTVGGEIDDDAEAEGDRQPRQQPARRDFGQCPLRKQPAKPGGPIGQPARQQQPGPPPRGVDLGRPGFGPCPRSLGVGHDACPDAQLQPGSMLTQPEVVTRRTVVNGRPPAPQESGGPAWPRQPIWPRRSQFRC